METVGVGLLAPCCQTLVGPGGVHHQRALLSLSFSTQQLDLGATSFSLVGNGLFLFLLITRGGRASPLPFLRPFGRGFGTTINPADQWSSNGLWLIGRWRFALGFILGAAPWTARVANTPKSRIVIAYGTVLTLSKYG